MELARFAVVTVLMGILCFHLVREIAAGFRTGKIRYGRGRGEHFAHRNQQPLLFWLLVFVFAVFALASVGAIAWVAHGAFFK